MTPGPGCGSACGSFLAAPLEAFAPLVRRVLSKPRMNTYHAPAGAGSAG